MVQVMRRKLSFGRQRLSVAVVLTVVALSACTTTGGSFCAIEHPIRPTKAEVATLSDASVAAILAHNEKGQSLCRWKP